MPLIKIQAMHQAPCEDHDVATKAVAKLGDLKNQHAIFYGVGFVRPHLPFVAPDEYWNLYNPSDLVYPERDAEPVNGLSYSYEGWNELRTYGECLKVVRLL